jgi:hypothetical protein
LGAEVTRSKTVGEAVAALLREGSGVGVRVPHLVAGGAVSIPPPFTVTIQGLRVVSEANSHTHWRVRQKRARAQRELVRAALCLRGLLAYTTLPGLRVTFTRIIGKHGQRFDSDNLEGSFKHVRDEVAALVGRDDGDPWWRWVVSRNQERGPEYGVRIAFEPLTGEG